MRWWRKTVCRLMNVLGLPKVTVLGCEERLMWRERAGCLVGEYVGVKGETEMEEAESSEDECEEEQRTGDRLVRATVVEG